MGKLIGFIVGYLVARMPGAVIGLLIGWFIDNLSVIRVEQPSGGGGPYTGRREFYTIGPTDFTRTLLMLSAAVMRADGKVMRSELEYAKSFFVRQFGELRTGQLLYELRDILQQDIPLHIICSQVRHSMRYEVRLQLLHYLFGLAASDGGISEGELEVVKTISRLLGITDADMVSIRAMFQADRESDYRILEITPDASDEDVKRAFRTMAKKYHPDKLTQMGEEFQKAGQEKFRMVQEAYTRIKQKRGMN